VSIAEVSQSIDMDRRFGGLDRLYGVASASRMRESHVVVVGLGGVGSWAAEALARSAISRMTLIDLDHVSESNINRQIQALDSTIGMSKIDAMVLRVAQINPNCQIHAVDEFVSPENWLSLLPTDADAVIDACDQVLAKTAMAQWARDSRSLFVAVGAAGGKRMPQLATVADLSDCTHDPLLSQVRYRLRKFHGAPREGKKIGISCVFSPEPVQSSHTERGESSDNTLNCHGYGSTVAVTASFGMCAAGWVMNELSNRL
jgi:tRNA A37 threonylcarbamoyladenosine dehydratase